MGGDIKNGLRYIAITGNILFSLWLLYNGIDEGFHATPMQLTAYIGLWVLLALNTYLVYGER